jgi:hypothetical protein
MASWDDHDIYIFGQLIALPPSMAVSIVMEWH